MQINSQDTNPNGGGGYITEPCKGMFVVDDLVVNDADGFAEVSTTCLASDKGMDGCTQNDRIFLTRRDKENGGQLPFYDRLLTLAVATHVITKEYWTECHDTGQPIEFDENEIIGKLFCGELKRRKEKDGSDSRFFSFNFDFYSPFSDRAKSFPKDTEALRDMAEGLGLPMPGEGDGGASGAATGKPKSGGGGGQARQQKATAAASNGSVESYDDV